MNQKNKGYIVPHTHWDREWRYAVWQNRILLVEFINALLEVMENNDDYKYFLLDGQSIIIEDYLQIKPENKERLVKLIRDGRIAVGPWYTLPDFYPVDGECLVRNLLKGIRYSDSIGGHLKVAYETFGWGRTAQLPQIYKGFGFDFVIAAKHVSSERAPESEFLWESPDGTGILATRLGREARANFFMNTYIPITQGIKYTTGNEYRLQWGKTGQVIHQADENGYRTDHMKLGDAESIHADLVEKSFLAAWDAVEETTVKSHRLLMSGSDNTGVQPMIPAMIRQANEIFKDKEFILAGLEEYIGHLKSLIDISKLKILKGELRDGPSSKCSCNALAVRPFIKKLNKKVQNSLIYTAEPLLAMNRMLGEHCTEGFMEKAFEYLLKAHAHDSINGVMPDKSVEDEIYRLKQALDISEGIIINTSGKLIEKITMQGISSSDVFIVIMNTAPFKREEIVKVYADIPRELNVWDFDIEDCHGVKLEKQLISRQEVNVPVNDVNARPWPFYADRYVFYMATGEIPAGGYKTVKIVPATHFNRDSLFWADVRKNSGKEICRNQNAMENEYLKVEVNGNGTIDIMDKSSNRLYKNLNYYEDTGDGGDYWVYYPPYENRTYSSIGNPAKIWMENNGELSATLVSEIVMHLPAFSTRPISGIGGQSRRAGEEKELKITTYYTLKKGSKKVDIKVKVFNSVEDHRLRVMFDTGINASYSFAGGHFTVDKRPVEPVKDKDGLYYPEMQTYPHQQFVDISDGDSGLALINNCLCEFEAMCNDKRTAALTLFRSVKNILCTEFRTATVLEDQKGSQSPGEHEFDYSIYPHAGFWHDAGIYPEAVKFNTPLRLFQASPHEGMLPPEYSFFSINSSGLILSAIKKAEDRNSVILRVFNPAEDIREGIVHFSAAIKEAYMVNLNEERIGQMLFENGHDIQMVVGGNKIMTVELVLMSLPDAAETP